MEENAFGHFLAVAQALARLGEASEEVLRAIGKVQVLASGGVLVQTDAVCDHVYFVHRGLSRTFYLNDGKDVTDWFSPEGTFAVSLISFITGQVDRRSIVMLEPSTVVGFGKLDLEKACAQHHEIEHFVRQLVCLGLVQLQTKLDDLHFATAKTRYQRLSESNPSILQRVPLGMVASYLGITQETLSRIRAER